MTQKMTIRPRVFAILLAPLALETSIYGAETKNGEVVASSAADKNSGSAVAVYPFTQIQGHFMPRLLPPASRYGYSIF
jgi:hypothetical protein